MSTVAEIENALRTLPTKDAREVATWLQDYLGHPVPSEWENELAAMAADPAMQRELRNISREFADAERDGLEKS